MTIDAVGSLAPSQALLPEALSAAQAASASWQQPPAVEVAKFERAAALPEVEAVPHQAGDALSARLAHQIDSLSAHLQAPPPLLQNQALENPAQDRADPKTAGNPSQAGHSTDREKTQQAVVEMDRVYMFAIETMLASRGSTETTKIFNVLLRGQ